MLWRLYETLLKTEFQRRHSTHVHSETWYMCHPETCFRLAWCAVLKNAHFWYVSDWNRTSFVLARADTNVFLTHCIWSRPTFIIDKQTNAAWPYLWSLRANSSSMLQGLVFNMRLPYDKVCTVPIWNMFQKCQFFRTTPHANLKHVSGWHIFTKLSMCSSPNPYQPHLRPTPFCRLTLSQRSFYPYAPTLWNYLPE